jgi:hypothetical protein
MSTPSKNINDNGIRDLKVSQLSKEQIAGYARLFSERLGRNSGIRELQRAEKKS